jgi:hypothetical protein
MRRLANIHALIPAALLVCSSLGAPLAAADDRSEGEGTAVASSVKSCGTIRGGRSIVRVLRGDVGCEEARQRIRRFIAGEQSQGRWFCQHGHPGYRPYGAESYCLAPRGASQARKLVASYPSPSG